MSTLFAQKVPKSSKKSPYKIYYIVESLEEYDSTPINAMKELLKDQDISVQVREYNSLRYSDDRDLVEHLPAFHFYINKDCMRTFYTDDNYIETIQEGIHEYHTLSEQRWSIIKWLTKRSSPFKHKSM